MQSLDATELAGTEALDEAVRASSKGKFGSAEEVINKILEDCEKADDADTFLREYCGIVLENDDTGAISGWDMGSGVVKTAESIVQENSVRDSNFTDSSFTVQGLTFKLGRWINSDDTTSITFDDLNDDQKFVWQSLYSYWANSALTLINESYGYNFTDADASVNEITVTFVRNSRSGELASTYYVDLDPPDGKIDQLVLTINTAHYANFAADDVNGISSSGQEYLDRTIAHELTHAVMNAKIAYRYDLPMIITEGTAEITQGIDDVRAADLLKLAGDVDLMRQTLILDNDYNSVEGITAPDYSGGYIFLRYLAWQSVDTGALGISVDNRTGNKLVAGSRFADTITNIAANATIASYEFADSITNSGSNALIDAGADADFISNSGKAATIIADKGNDTITNTQAGVYYRYDSGDGFDLITGASASDTLFIGTGDYSVSSNANDKIISLDNGAITLTNAADIDITILDPKRFVSLSGGAYYNDFDNATIFGSNDVDSINNTASFVTISALGGDDYIGE